MKATFKNSLIISVIIIFYSCGQTAEQRAAIEKAKQDSIVNLQAMEEAKQEAIKSAPAPEPVKMKSSTEFIYVSEVSFLNDRNNTYSHFYSVFVKNFNDKDENIWKEMESEAKSKPYDTNGFTALLFFNNKKNTPTLVKGKGLDFDEKYDKYNVAAFWHYPSGQSEFKRYPMK